MDSLYEELLRSPIKDNLKKKHHSDKRARELRAQKKEALKKEAEDRMLTVEEVKAIRRKETKMRARYNRIAKEEQWVREWNEKYWMDITRTWAYLWESFWKEVSEEYHKIEADSRNISKIVLSEDDEKDMNYLSKHMYDWWYNENWNWISRYNWHINKTKKTMNIWQVIKLMSTTSIESIYAHYLCAQEVVYTTLEQKAKERGMSVQSFVEWGFREEDIIWKVRWRWKTRRITPRTRQGSWLEDVLKDIPQLYGRSAPWYVKMIKDWTFMRWEVCLPYTVYLLWDYVFFGTSASAVVSLTWNWEVFSEENREVLHKWWRYPMCFLDFTVAHKIPRFHWEWMRLVRVPSDKIYDEDEWTCHSNWFFNYYLVPQTKYLWVWLTKDYTLQSLIDKYKVPDLSEYAHIDRQNKSGGMIGQVKRHKKRVFYFNTDD